MILAFVAGVRRGFGFANPRASTGSEIATMLLYFVPAGLALVAASLGGLALALALLVIGFALVAILDRHAAFTGNAPAHFARLRGPQMAIAAAALVALLVRLLMSSE